jgi:hypothetical protein
MAVPNTSTFSLQDVVDEINPTTDDLVDCIADASSSGYDTSYYSSPATSLLEFRNYSATIVTDIGATSTSNTGITLNLGVVPVGDMIVITLFQQYAGSTVTPASGYTLIEGVAFTGYGRVHTYYKTNTISTTQSVTFSTQYSGYKHMHAMSIPNTTGIGESTGFGTPATTFSPTETGLTANSLVFLAWCTRDLEGGNPVVNEYTESGTAGFPVIDGFPSFGAYRAYISYYIQPSSTTNDRWNSIVQWANQKTTGQIFEIKR